MSGERDEFAGGNGSAVRTEMIQPGKDLQSNWEVDLATKLEEYLLKICSGELTASQEEQVLHSVNFVEAALLLQGSVQVYSKKVEYLYSLVLHALEFLSQKRQQQDDKENEEKEDPEKTNKKKSDAVVNEDEDEFFIEDVPEDPKADLDISKEKEAWKAPIKPPANLIVMEGDCFDINGSDEIDSFLLATCDFYKNFLLLDPSDAGSINDFLNQKEKENKKENEKEKEKENENRKEIEKTPNRLLNSARSKNHQSARKQNEINLDQNENLAADFESQERENDMNFNNNDDIFDNDFDMGPQNEPNFNDFEEDSDDDDDINSIWEPLNPYESGSLRIKPFKKVKNYRRPLNFTKKKLTLASKFPLAKFDPNVILQEGPHTFSEFLPEIMRMLKEEENNENKNVNNEGDFDENNGDYDIGNDDMADDIFDNINDDLPPYPEKENLNDDIIGTSGTKDDDFCSNDNLEELCRKHLDTILYNITESEKQSEIASRVSTWKDKIETNLDEQDKHGPFDIGIYGEKIIEKLSLEAENRNKNKMSFSDLMSGKPEHDVSRSFAAMLQLVNSGKVDLEKPPYGEDILSYTAEKPFFVKLLNQDKNTNNSNPEENINVNFENRKRNKSPLKKGNDKGKGLAESSFSDEPGSPDQKVKKKVKGKGKLGKVTPEGKKRRKAKQLDN